MTHSSLGKREEIIFFPSICHRAWGICFLDTTSQVTLITSMYLWHNFRRWV